MGDVIIGGAGVPLVNPVSGGAIEVLGPDYHGMEFSEGSGGRLRVEPMTLGVVHWTGAENDPETMYRTLKRRGLSVTFCIAPNGVLYQFCDPVPLVTFHAGMANGISWGVEVVNAGIRRANTLWRAPRYRKLDYPPRHPYRTEIHGRKLNAWDFYPTQIGTLCALHAAMVAAVPSYENRVCTRPEVINWRAWRGAVGHYNVSRKKVDPGTLPMQRLAAFAETINTTEACK